MPEIASGQVDVGALRPFVSELEVAAPVGVAGCIGAVPLASEAVGGVAVHACLRLPSVHVGFCEYAGFQRVVALIGDMGAGVEPLFGFAGDDVDHGADGVGAIERGSRSVDDFDSLDAVDVDLVQVHVAACAFGDESLAVHQEEDVAAVQALDPQVVTHSVGLGNDAGNVVFQGLQEGHGAGFFHLAAAHDRGLHGRLGETLFRARACHDQSVQTQCAVRPVLLRPGDGRADRREASHYSLPAAHSDTLFSIHTSTSSVDSGRMPFSPYAILFAAACRSIPNIRAIEPTPDTR